MVRHILSEIEEIIHQRMGTIQFANSQFRFCFSSSSQYGSLQLKLAAPTQDRTGQDHHASEYTVTGLRSLALCCICQWLNTGSWTRHSTGYFKPALSLCAFERGIMRTNVRGVFQWWTPVHDVWLSTDSHQLTTSHCCHSRCLCFLSFRQKPCVSWLMMLIFNN